MLALNSTMARSTPFEFAPITHIRTEFGKCNFFECIANTLILVRQLISAKKNPKQINL